MFPEVAVSEAVELAKGFSGEEAPPSLEGSCGERWTGWGWGMARRVSRARSAIRWERHRRTFEEYIRAMRFTEEPRLGGLEEAMRYSMLAGGKRVRPTLCMEVAWVCGAEPAHVLLRPPP